MKNRRTLLFSIVILAIAAAVIAGALLLRDPSVDTPAVVLPTREAGADNGGSGADSDVSPAELTTQTVQAVVATLERTDTYSRSVTIEDFWKGGSSSETLDVWVTGGSVRIRSESERKNILLTSGGTLYIWHNGSNEVFSDAVWSAGEDKWLRCLTYEDLLSVDPADITAAAYVEYAGEGCVMAEYISGSFGYRDVVYVSVATGLLMGAETWDGDELIYSMTSGEVTLAAPDSSLFKLPEAAS